MRRPLVIVGSIVVVLAALALAWLLRDTTPPAAPREIEAPAPTPPGATVVAERAARPHSISGRVLRDGVPVKDVLVQATRAPPGTPLSALPCPCEDCADHLMDPACEFEDDRMAKLVSDRPGDEVEVANTRTDAAGHFELTPTDDDAVTLWAERAPLDVARELHVEIGSHDVTLTLQPGLTLRGTILLDEDDSPVAGAKVTLVERDHPRYVTVTSDAKGRFSVSRLPPGLYLVHAESPPLLGIGTLADASSEFELRLSRAHEVDGIVLEHGALAKGTDVYDNHMDARVTTPDGTFHFRLREGEHTLVAERGDLFDVQKITVPLKGRVTLKLQRGVHVHGTVRSQTGEPLDARVELGDVMLDAEGGSYDSYVMPAHAVTLRVATNNYVPLEEKVELTGAELHRDFVLRPMPMVLGRVVDESGEGVEGARLGGNNIGATSGDGGYFALGVPEHGKIELTASHDAFHFARFTVDAPATGVVVRLSKGLAIRGWVETRKGKRFPECPVWAGINRTTTDSEGNFTLTGVDRGGITVSAGSFEPNGPRSSLRIDVGPEGAHDVRLVLSMHKGISGRVVAANGSALEPELDVLALDANGGRAASNLVEDNGKFHLDGLEDGAYTVVLKAPGRRVEAQAHAGDTNVQLVLHRNEISGRVLQHGGRPLQKFSVNGTELEAADGRFKVGSEAGAVKLQVDAASYAPLIKEVNVPQDGALDVGDLVLGDGADFRVRVVDGDSAAPLAGTELVVTRLAHNLAVTTGDDGRAVMHGLPSGVEIYVSEPEHMKATVVFSGDETEQTVRLSRGEALRVRLLDANGAPMRGHVEAILAPASTAAGFTDEHGELRLTGLKPGTWLVNAGGLHMTPGPEASATVDVVANGVAFVELRLGGGLRFAATLPPGQWTAMLTVVGTPLPTQQTMRMLPTRAWRTTTTSDGAFTFSGVAAGVYQLVMVSPESSYFVVPVTVTGAAGQIVTLPAPDTLTPLRR